MAAVISALSSSNIEAAEWETRCDMAAVFRACARMGWNEQIANHNSIMLPRATPDAPETFLINPRGLRFDELTASSLIVCDLAGNVLRGTGQLRSVAFHIHTRIHIANPAATCVLHVHPQYLTALSMLETPEFELAHFNNTLLNDRVVFDTAAIGGADSQHEGDRLAALLGTKTILVMGAHGVTVVGPDIASAFDELYFAERTTMYQMTAWNTGRKLRNLPQTARQHWNGPWGEKLDARLHLDAVRRVLDKQEPDYKT